jgi:hypothetical protein
MTGGAFFSTSGATDEEYELHEQGGNPERHAVQWVGKPGVKGSKFARLPLLTMGMLGIQVSLGSFHSARGSEGIALAACPASNPSNFFCR